jgi:hypothetical protein
VCSFVIGLVIGLSTVRVNGYSCGNAFHGGSTFFVSSADCAGARDGHQLATWILFFVAAALGVAGGIARQHERQAATRAR